jgi:peptidoglycan/xylan/chitin deacetylase (PgdA/CDA1 family)
VAEPQVLVTTSWDDGHQLDMRLAGVLRDCGCKGTFYVSPQSREIPTQARLRAADLRDLSATFEVGSHTLTHPHLTRLPPREAAHEISDGRRAVEDIINGSATSFCYPYGAYNPEHVGMVRDAGCLVGRTIRRFNVGSDGDPLQMATTTHASRYKADALRIARTVWPTRLLRMWRKWDVLARSVFQEVATHGGVIHLWGHSWEIEQNNDWGRLASLLRELSSLSNVTMLTNAELGEHMRSLA